MQKYHVIDPNLISAYFHPKLGLKRRKMDPNKEKFQEGDIFSLQGVECDYFNMPIKEYEVIKKIDSIYGVDLNGVVVKQISGESDTVFSLTKTDCQTLGIEFHPKLLFFPQNMGWKEVSVRRKQTKFKFDPSDLSTYPVDKESGMIKHIVVCIDNVKKHMISLSNYHKCINYYSIGNICDISSTSILNGLCLKPKMPKAYNHSLLRLDYMYKGRNITNLLFKDGDVFQSQIFYEFDVYLNPKDVVGLSVNDVFDVFIENKNFLTSEETQTLTQMINIIKNDRKYRIPVLR